MLIEDAAVGLGVQPLDAGHQLAHQRERRQFGFETEVGFPDRRLLQVRRQQVHVGRRRRAREGGLGIRVGGEAGSLGQAVGIAGAVQRCHGHAGVAEGVGQPHIRSGTLEQTETAAQLHAALGRAQVPVEAEARLHQVVAVQRVGVVHAETTAFADDGVAVHTAGNLGFGNVGIGKRCVGNALLIDPQTRCDAEVGAQLPVVLQEETRVAITPCSHRIVERAARQRLLHRVSRRVAEAEVLQYRTRHRGGIGRVAVDRTEGVSAVVAAEGVVAVRVLQEGVVHVVVDIVTTELQLVGTHVQGGAEVGVQRLGLQHIEVPAAFGAEVQEARIGIGAGGCVGGQRAVKAQAHHGQPHAIDRCGLAVVVALGNLQLCAEVGRPVRKPLTHQALHRLGLVVPIRAQRKAGG